MLPFSEESSSVMCFLEEIQHGTPHPDSTWWKMPIRDDGVKSLAWRTFRMDYIYIYSFFCAIFFWGGGPGGGV